MNFMQSVQSRNRNSSMHKETRDSSDNSPDNKSNISDTNCTTNIERKSVEDLLAGSQDVLGSSISSAISFTSGTVLQASPLLRRRSPSPSSTTTDGNRNSSSSKEHSKSETHLIVPALPDRPEGADETRIRQPEEKQNPSDIVPLNPLNRSASQEIERPKSISKVSERAKKKSWYSVLYPTYKSRSEDFKKLFKGVPDDERLVVDYSCALQKDILVHGRLYVSQNFLCFYANIFRWETSLSIKWKDVTSITKEKTARVIPNAILVCTDSDKHFLTSFATRDKAYLMLFRVWQNALMDKQMQPQEMWQWVHNCYGDELGLTSDDEDYIDPYEDREFIKGNQGDKLKLSTDSVSEEQSNPESDMMASINNQTSSDQAPIGNILGKGESSSMGQKRLQKGLRRGEDTPSKHIPTDMSDTSDSEQDKNMDLTEQPECTSMHEGRQMIHTILPINVDILFNLLFSKSKFLENFHEGRKTTNMIHGDWIINEEGLKQRTVTLTVALAQPVGPKSTDVTEIQTLRECSHSGQLYSVDIHSSNAGIPYADSFYATMHYCLVRTVDDHTMFSVHAQIKYKKSVWGFVKGFIEKNTWNGLEDFYTALVRALQNEYCIPPAKAKGRRPRRGNSSLQRPTEEPSKAKQVPFTTKVAIKADKVAATTIKHESLSWFVIILLVTLILLNVILYLKLWDLETREAGRHRYPDFLQLKDPPKSHDDWIKLMQQQEALHSAEMVKWQKVLQIAVELLKKVSVVCEKIVTNATVLLQNSAMTKDEL
ncbi:protein Aster-B-like isoform X2 [Phlebotomus papatasi]|uniref:protein Aster-B-like isoform X2 n=1 Tax=Phlebotomus papatasi TaxID=29031 RepID=UPI002483E5C9|nr:protein Aster-B-like isoform X2 [Phlebotomus papatasi]